MSDKVFPLPIPVVVATGEYESGKTLLILTTGYPLERVLLYDNEESATLYAGKGNFERVDIAGELGREHENGWTNLDFYLAWRDHMRGIEPDQYDVIGVDPIERIESGLTDWTGQNPGYFGHSRNQYERMSGLFWGDVKDLWGRHILEMKARSKMVILTAHMRNVYRGNKPVPGKRERKGKDTLSELASLEIELVRQPGQFAPSAKVIKTRLFFGELTDPKSMRPMFDPWIKEFTWDKVRWYMEHGASDEPELPPEPTEEEKAMQRLEMESLIAAAKLAEMEAAAAKGVDWQEFAKEVTENRQWPIGEVKQLLAEKFGKGYNPHKSAEYIKYLETFYEKQPELPLEEEESDE